MKRAEVELANSAKERNLINLLFKRKLTPEEEEEQRKRDEESKSTDGVTIQRNFRKAREIRRAAARVAERRRKILAGCVSATKTVASFVLLYVALIFFGRFLAAAFGARRAAYEATTATVSDAWSRARAQTRRSSTTATCATASRPNSRLATRSCSASGIARSSDRVAALELERSAATTAVDSNADAPARRLRLRRRREDRRRGTRARRGRTRGDALRRGGVAARRGESVGGAAAQSRARRVDATPRPLARAPPTRVVSYSAQVAAAATAAASVTLEARVSEATAAARSATDEAEATKVEIEVLRNLIDEVVPFSAARGASVGPRLRTLAPRRRSPPRPSRPPRRSETPRRC